MTGWLAVIGIVLVVTASAYSGLSSSDVEDALAERHTPVPVSEMDATPASTPIVQDPAPEPTATPETAPTQLLNRLDCGQIRGTDYYSPDERTWYLANCVGR